MKFSEHAKHIVLLIVAIAILVGLRYTLVMHNIDITYFKIHRDDLAQLIQHQYALSVLFYTIIYIAVVVCMIPITLLLTLLSGYFFGGFAGTAISTIAATLSALVSTFLYKHFIIDFIRKKYGGPARKLIQELHTNGPWYILSLHLIPITPFALINILTAFSDISVWHLIWSTALGVMPGMFLYAFAGYKLGHVQSMKDILSLPMLLLLVGLALFALIPVFIKHVKKHYDY